MRTKSPSSRDVLTPQQLPNIYPDDTGHPWPLHPVVFPVPTTENTTNPVRSVASPDDEIRIPVFRTSDAHLYPTPGRRGRAFAAFFGGPPGPPEAAASASDLGPPTLYKAPGAMEMLLVARTSRACAEVRPLFELVKISRGWPDFQRTRGQRRGARNPRGPNAPEAPARSAAQGASRSPKRKNTALKGTGDEEAPVLLRPTDSTLLSNHEATVHKCNALFVLTTTSSLELRLRIERNTDPHLRPTPSPTGHHHPPFKNSTPFLDTHNRHLPKHLSGNRHRHRRNHLRYTHHRHRHLDHGETALAVVSRHHRRRRRCRRQHRRRNNRTHNHAGLHMYHLHLMTRVDANNHCGLLLDILDMLHWKQLLLKDCPGMPDMLDGDKLLSRDADVESVGAVAHMMLNRNGLVDELLSGDTDVGTVAAVAAHDTRGCDGVRGGSCVYAEGVHGGRSMAAVVCMTVVHVVSLGMVAFLGAMVAFWTVIMAFCDGLVQGERGRGWQWYI